MNHDTNVNAIIFSSGPKPLQGGDEDAPHSAPEKCLAETPKSKTNQYPSVFLGITSPTYKLATLRSWPPTRGSPGDHPGKTLKADPASCPNNTRFEGYPG